MGSVFIPVCTYIIIDPSVGSGTHGLEPNGSAAGADVSQHFVIFGRGREQCKGGRGGGESQVYNNTGQRPSPALCHFSRAGERGAPVRRRSALKESSRDPPGSPAGSQVLGIAFPDPSHRKLICFPS
jgi:hypothetical protein